MPSYNVESPSPFVQALIDSSRAEPSSRFNGMNVYVKDYCPICHKANDDNSEENKENIPASRIITEPSRRFVTDEILADYDIIKRSYMNVTIYDNDRNGIVDLSERSLTADSVDWQNVKNRPNITNNLVQDLITNLHSHTNKEALDDIGININTNLPTWQDKPWPSSTSVKSMPLESRSIRNTFIQSTEPLSALIGDLWIQIDNTRNEIKGIHVKKNSTIWFKLTITTLTEIIKDKVLSSLAGMSGADINITVPLSKSFNGNDVDTEYLITHSLNTKNIMVQIIDDNSGETVHANVYRNTQDTIIISFNVAPKTTDSYTIIIIKGQ